MDTKPIQDQPEAHNGAPEGVRCIRAGAAGCEFLPEDADIRTGGEFHACPEYCWFRCHAVMDAAASAPPPAS